MIDTWLARCARLVAHHPRSTLIGLFVVTVLAIIAGFFIRLDPDLEKSLPVDHEGIELRRLVETNEDTHRTLLIALEGKSIEALVPRAVAEIEKSPYLQRVTSTRDEFVGAWGRALRASPLASVSSNTLDRVAARLTIERRSTIESIPDRIAEDPFVGLELARRDPLDVRWLFDEAGRDAMPETLDPTSPYLVAKDGNVAFVKALGREKPFDLTFSRNLIADLRTRLSALAPDLRDYRLIGSYASSQVDSERITNDLYRSCFWAMTFIFLFLTFSTRRFLDPPILIFPTSIVMLWTMSFGSLIFGPLTPLATSAAPVLCGLSVDIAIHYLGRYRRERRNASASEATIRTTRRIGPPLLAGTLTSIAAFASLMFTRFGSFRSFGALLGLGLAFAFIVTLLLLPLLLWRTRPNTSNTTEEEPTSPVVNLARRLVESRAGPATLVLIFTLAVGGWIGVALLGVEFDADPRRLRPTNDPVSESATWLEDALGFSPIPITLLVHESVSVADCARALGSLEEAGSIEFSLGVHRLVPTGDQRQRVESFRSRIAGWRAAADDDLDQAGLRSNAFAPALDELARALQEDGEWSRTLTTLSWRGSSYWRFMVFPRHTLWETNDRATFRARVQESFGDPAHRVQIVAPFGLADDLNQLLTDDLLRSASIAAIIVVLLAMAFSGGFRFGMLSLLPTATALGITLGGMALFGYPIHLGNLVAVPFLIGLGIDDGIHMVTRHREGVSTRALMESSGHSVWRTSMTTLLGFGSLAFASSPGLASLGWMMTVGIAGCFVTSIVTLPLLTRMALFRVDSTAENGSTP